MKFMKNYKKKDLITEANAAGHTIVRLRSDNAKEFDSEKIKTLLHKHSIKHEFSTPYVPQQNGRAERKNRTVIEIARSMLTAEDLPLELWGEATRTAGHIRNRIPLDRLNDKTPYEVWTGCKPNVEHLRVYGSRAFMLLDESKRTKMDKKCREIVLVGYEPESHAYCLWERDTR